MEGTTGRPRWDCDLYEVRYYTDKDGVLLTTRHIAYHTTPDFELLSERAPSRCTWIEFDCIRESVGEAPVVGSMYGLPIHEDNWSYAQAVLKRNPLKPHEHRGFGPGPIYGGTHHE